MNTKYINTTILLSLAPIFLLFYGCEKEKGILSNQKVFDVSIFKSNLQSQLNGAVGFAFVINENGKWADTSSFGTGGLNATGSGVVSASVLSDINIASVTKPLTCMAAIKLMEQRGIDLDDQIGVWLPSYWVKRPEVLTLTFRQLLSHTSGIRQAGTSWDSLKAAVNTPLASKSFSYANANFALFRAILPKINDLDGFNTSESNSATFESWMSSKYISLMQDLVFTPAGLTNITCSIDPNNTTMQMLNELNNPPLVPRSAGDWTETCGGGGFYASTMEMAQIMAFLAHSEVILTNAQKTLMDNGLLGWDPNDSYTSSHGRVFGKDGSLYIDNDGDNVMSAGDSGLQTWVGKFPNGVELALAITSRASGSRNLASITSIAFEAAWVDE